MNCVSILKRTALKASVFISPTAVSRHRNLATMVKAQKFIYNKRFVGEPKLTDFTLEEEELPALKDGGKQ